MEPTFLRDLERMDALGPQAELIKMVRTMGSPAPQIFHLFAFKPAATHHLSRFTQDVMRGPSPLSAGMRELNAAFTSSGNHCPF